MTTVEILAPDKETVERILKGCEHYGMKATYNRRTAPYVHVSFDESEAINLFWLGANIALPKVETWLYESTF
jgi:hypothetical protein